MNDIEEIGKIVRFHRKVSRLTQIELADLAGVGKTVIADIERSKRTVKFNTLYKVLGALNVGIEFISPLMHRYRELENEKS